MPFFSRLHQPVGAASSLSTRNDRQEAHPTLLLGDQLVRDAGIAVFESAIPCRFKGGCSREGAKTRSSVYLLSRAMRDSL